MPTQQDQSKFNRENMSLAPKELLLQLITSQYGPQNAVIAEDALKTQKKQIEEGMLQGGMGFEDIMKSKGVDLNSLLTSSGSEKSKGNFFHTPFQINQETGQVTPESILGGLIKSHPDDTLKMVQANQLSSKSQGLNPENAIERLASLNSTIDKKLPGYQATQTADGNFIVRPKSSGVLAQLSPEEQDSMSESLLAGNIVPSQLPRLQKSQVLAAAMQKDPSYDPVKADIDFAVNKVGAGNFEKLYNNVVSFERTFRKNADTALKISEGFPLSKIPLLNRAIVSGKKNIEGDPQASRMLAAINTVATEYARLTVSPGASGSVLSDTARHEAQNLLNAYMTDGQLKGLLDPENGVMSIDAKNRIAALEETRNEIKGRYNSRTGESSSKSNDLKAKYGLEQ